MMSRGAHRRSHRTTENCPAGVAPAVPRTQGWTGHPAVDGAATPDLGTVELAAGSVDDPGTGGIMVEQVTPENTSRRCSTCGFTHPDNRDGEDFECLKCGYQNHADYNAVAGLLPAGSKVA